MTPYKSSPFGSCALYFHCGTPKIWSSTRWRTENVRSVKKWTETRKKLPKTIPKTCWFFCSGHLCQLCHLVSLEQAHLCWFWKNVPSFHTIGYAPGVFPGKTFPTRTVAFKKMVRIPMFSRQFQMDGNGWKWWFLQPLLMCKDLESNYPIDSHCHFTSKDLELSHFLYVKMCFVM